ncbi:metal ABC transporter ATP-binding protein [Candidatus Synechococcus calcipolaris G9]|uniref:Metal ABC transporter ATP-binding protein n=1 Tax=Candidatus Synechococcus calcipolaris G9 TaxID=1497997 RepID=A0ABT6F0B3_9SYNE|nr:metal ABC transporter ATP-binding protein [Candidatus Synechococcus calcipolaris]MDG2991259.1 metal ABC transporter ATP-binding protein [Candidatus Synechococcus calcipolaris G9]
MLQVQELSVSYRGVAALEQINYQVPAGELVGVVGPNGAGKSTMVKAMLGLIRAVAGKAMFQGKVLGQQLGRVAYVPQRSHIDWDYPITVWNVAMMARTVQTGLFRRTSVQSQQTVKAALERVGMYHLRDRQIGELSGGQQQRVFIARALAKEADLLIFDEPFTGVDRKTEDIIFDIFQELKAQAKTLLVINHDLGESLNYYDRILLLNKRLIAMGAKTDVITTQNLQEAYGSTFSLAAA